MNVKIDDSLAKTLQQAPTLQTKTDVLFDYMHRRGRSFYDESVTQLAHALQAAHLARSNGANSEQVVAALLHDIGHFLTDEHAGENNFQDEDWFHEDVGAEVLEPFFPSVIIESIRLHVPAKRYLCSVDENYYQGLSPGSKLSLELQGGKMSAEERQTFENNPWYATAVLVRRWDDGAKVPDLAVPNLEAYRNDVESCLLY